ncbi:AAA family ATPase [Flavobacterium columnare]|uniref:ATPase AAA-type core domain-containing protein n=2 Tax=Flavobacterium TaxID=237 RepID=A0AA94F216_9FLAO|nr:ATP-binding protein [Flavobacterium columnare]MCH4830160.1 AAA family ATPase [Flavobacterium columnare]MCH4832458.1 AAA family ATPase [Flavobacterium columnare]
MSNNHLTYFKVENFKKFDALEVKNIGQFNLIVGDNNVGKTCLLEALLVEVRIDDDFLSGLFYTTNLEYFLFALIERKLINVNSLVNESKYIIDISSHFSKNHKEKIVLHLNDKKVLFSKELDIIFLSKELNAIKKNSELIELSFGENFFLNINEKFNYPMVSFSNKELDVLSLYNRLSTKKEKESLLQTLKVIFPSVQNVEYKVEYKTIPNTFIFTFEDKDEFIPLNYLGDGFKRIFYVVLKALSLKGKRIMIDEIEIGIHHSRQKDFFINLFKICKELDVQLFATTHSNECIKAFVEASTEVENEKEVRVIKLEESTDKTKIYSSTFYFENIQAGFESNVDLRG